GQPSREVGLGNARTPARRFWRAAAAVLLLALCLRIVLLAANVFPFNADEAIVGLMARHILAGTWPTFFYGQAYLGSLDAAFVAAAFGLLGETLLAIRIVQTLLFLGTILTTMALTRELGFSILVSTLAGLLLAIPSVNVTLYTTVSLGGYGEALLLGNLILLATLRLIRRPAFALWGVLAGFALWVFGLTLIYTVPCAVALTLACLRRLPRREVFVRGAALLAGAMLGALPVIVWGAANGPGHLLGELMGSAIAGASAAELPSAVASHLVNLALFGPTVLLGVRPPWSATPLGMPLAPIAVIVWLAVVVLGLRRGSWPVSGLPGRTLLLTSVLTLLVAFLLTPFGADPSGRYFLPLAIPLVIFGAAGIQAARDLTGRPWPLALAVLLLAFHLWTNLQAAVGAPGFTTQFDASTVFDRAHDKELVDFLLDQEATAGYSTYWVSYPLAFMSQERLVYLPHLPYHSDFRYTTRDDRYEPYRAVVAAESRPSFITARQPWLDAVLRERLRARGVDFEEKAIGDYRVFYDLSETVRPNDLGLGGGTAP
ncbi:MAG: putative rane protein, partial [Anaerolineales bacterium]|nr:putative rane protein [Anaerolineales bacterium]